jgi:hypothetical protein
MMAYQPYICPVRVKTFRFVIKLVYSHENLPVTSRLIRHSTYRDVPCCTVLRVTLNLFVVMGYYEVVKLKGASQILDGGVEADFCFGAGADNFAICEDEEYGSGVIHSID